MYFLSNKINYRKDPEFWIKLITNLNNQGLFSPILDCNLDFIIRESDIPFSLKFTLFSFYLQNQRFNDLEKWNYNYINSWLKLDASSDNPVLQFSKMFELVILV